MSRNQKGKVVFALLTLLVVQTLTLLLTFPIIIRSNIFTQSVSGLDVTQYEEILLMLTSIFLLISSLVSVGFDCILLLVLSKSLLKIKIELFGTVMTLVFSNCIAISLGGLNVLFKGFSLNWYNLIFSSTTMSKVVAIFLIGYFGFKVWNHVSKALVICLGYYIISVSLVALFLFLPI